MRIYLAGPLFTSYERRWNRDLARSLEKLGEFVYLPQEHEEREANAKSIFLMNIDSLNLCQILVANLDQPDPDSGTCFEVGYAFSKGIPIFYYRTDFRKMAEFVGGEVNLMLEMAGERIDSDYNTDPASLAKKIKQAIYK